jgi:hypothetical protein
MKSVENSLRSGWDSIIPGKDPKQPMTILRVWVRLPPFSVEDPRVSDARWVKNTFVFPKTQSSDRKDRVCWVKNDCFQGMTQRVRKSLDLMGQIPFSDPMAGKKIGSGAGFAGSRPKARKFKK